jgi:hypothetical protein
MFLTGTTNAMYYNKNENAYKTLIITVFTVLGFYTLYHTINNLPMINSLLLTGWLFLTHYFNLNKDKIFKNDKSDKIHLNEYLVNGSFVIGMSLFGMVDMLTYIFAMHLGGVVFNLFVNKVHSGTYLEKIDYTDDPTGKTVGVYIGRIHLKIPRISNSYFQLYLGLFMTTIWIVNQFTFGYKVIFDITTFNFLFK